MALSFCTAGSSGGAIYTNSPFLVVDSVLTSSSADRGGCLSLDQNLAPVMLDGVSMDNCTARVGTSGRRCIVVCGEKRMRDGG